MYGHRIVTTQTILIREVADALASGFRSEYPARDHLKGTGAVTLNMWCDELLTLYVVQQASPGEIVKATLEGCDGAPPLYAMIVAILDLRLAGGETKSLVGSCGRPAPIATNRAKCR